jgi:hypothetical protein
MAEKKPTDEKPDGPLGDSVGLAGWFIGPGVAALAPWFLPLMKADLIGEYQAKPANLCASLLAPAAFFVAAACYRRSSREKRRKHLLAIWLPVFVSTFIFCVWMSQTYGITWQWPGWGPHLRAVWFVVFLLVFASFAVMILLATYLLAKKSPS